VIDIVKKYNSKGLSCLPIKDDKSPYSKISWHDGFENESDYKGAFGIGIICGKKSDNLECIDFDNHFGDAKVIITEFIEQIKPIYEKYSLPIESTMNGGYHLLYRCDTINGNMKLAQRPKKDENGNWKPDTLIETRGQGGYFACDPTPGYKIVKNDILNIQYITPEERDELISIAKSFNEWTEVRKNEFESGDKPGDIFNNDSNAIHEVKSELLSKGWIEIKEGYWRRPGKDKGISATLGRVGGNIFCVFSTNAYPFESGSICKGYTPFQVIGLLKYNNDFKAFAKDLSLRYELKKTKEIQPSIEKDKLRDIIKKSYINLDIEIEKPPVILYISDTSGTQTVRKRLFTLGNFSCIIGKSKSRKTFCTMMFTSAMLMENKENGLYNKFYGAIPEDKKQILYFDTEQGDYDAANNIKRIQRLSDDITNLGAFNLREYSPLERCEIIEYSFSMFKQVSLVVIDGIADLARAINDEEEATRVVGLLMKWTKLYNCHIITILHQNKNDNFATGWLGSFIMKKAEVIISVAKEHGSDKDSHVSCDFARGIDFENFDFNINNGLPILTTEHKEYGIPKYWQD
jgi:hypothetical protein